MTELFKTYRPTDLNQVVGQDKAVNVLTKMVKSGNVPHAILFTGPSGCGKTTLARILKTSLDCSDSEFTELNCADVRGIEAVRDIRSVVPLAPMSGSCRIWLIDEAHKLTNDAQNALLKMLEDTPSHVYFFLATTEPGKVIKTIHTRCTPIAVKALTPRELCKLLNRVVEEESLNVGDEEVEKIADIVDGSARQALVLLDKIRDVDAKDQIEILEKSDYKRLSIEVCRALIKPRVTWSDIQVIISNIDEEPETLRRMILGYATAILLGKSVKLHTKAFLIIQACRDHWFDCGKAGLVAACWEVIHAGK